MKFSTALSCVLGAAAFAPLTASADDWSRSWVITFYEFAHIYGRDDAADSEPGTDCPHGANPDVDWNEVLLTGGRTPEEVAVLMDPENRGRRDFNRDHYFLRGPNFENIYLQPELHQNNDQYDVEGAVALGFDLDNNPETGGFISPDGTPGIDNAFYRASGCYMTFRGPAQTIATYSNDGMHDGVFSVVIVVSGHDSPQNDENATLGIYLSQDPMSKDANGEIAEDYTFRIAADARYETVTSVTVRDGVIETQEPTLLTLRDYRTPGFFPKELELHEGQIRFEMHEDGSLFGIFGGYREWDVHYRGLRGNGGHSAGAIHELVSHINLPVWWHALRRLADGMPDPETGQMMGISTVYRIWAIPAFVSTPEGDALVTEAVSFVPTAS